MAAYQNLTNSYFRHRGKAISTSIITLSDDINILKILDNKVTINNEDYSTIQNQPISTYSDNVFIFSAPNNNRPSSMRFYGLKLFGEIGDLLGNFVPVKKMNGQVGVYDKISKTIITSSSGNFITGPEINIIEEE